MPRRAELEILGEHPAGPRILAAYEAEADDAARAVAASTATAVRSRFPSGRTGSSITGRVTKTPTGLAITVAPSKARRHIARFKEGGTGLLGPRHRRIPAGRRGRLPSGAVPTGRGQAPAWAFERVREREADRTARELSAAASSAARRLGL